MYALGAIPETETVRLTAVPLLPAAIPATCVACSESSWVEREPGVLPGRARRRERPRDDHLRGRIGGVPLRIPGGHRVAGRVEERVRLVDALVDDADLDPLARGREVGAPHRGCADQLGTAVEERVVRDARVDLRDSRHRREPGDVGARHDDGDPVQDDTVVPADPRVRDRADDAALERALRRRECPEVRDARGRAHVEAATAGGRRGESTTRLGRADERRRAEPDDELDRAAGGGLRRLRGSRRAEHERSRSEEKCESPCQGVHVT